MARRAYTFVELIMVCILLSLLATLAVPFLADDGPGRVAAARERLWHDLLDAQAWSIANPSACATVRLGQQGYEIERAGSIAKVSFSEEGFDEARGVAITVTGVGPDGITFTHSGAVRGESDAESPVITLTSADGRTAASIEIRPTSGELRERRASQ